MKKFFAIFALTLLAAAPAFAGTGYFSSYNGGSGYNRSNHLSDYRSGTRSVSNGRYLRGMGSHSQNVTSRRSPSRYYSTSGAGRISQKHGRTHQRMLRQVKAQNAKAQRLQARAAKQKCGGFFGYCKRTPQLYRQGPSGNYARRNSVGQPSPVAVAMVMGQNPGMVRQRF
jgi:hypothetical protein